MHVIQADDVDDVASLRFYTLQSNRCLLFLYTYRFQGALPTVNCKSAGEALRARESTHPLEEDKMADAYKKDFFNVTFPAEYVAHVEINRPEKMNAFHEV